MNELIACCGLDCEKCDARIATVTNDEALREKTAALWSQLNGVEITPDRTAFARALAARLGAVTVLKGAFTVVAAPGGAWSVNTSGTPALATAGSGDVLTGLIGALLAIRPAEPFRMAQLGVFLHGVAGELGGAGLIADDLPELLPVLLRRLGGGGAAL